MDMNFGPIDGEDVLGFDFDSFLQENGDANDMAFGDASIAFASFDPMAETEV